MIQELLDAARTIAQEEIAKRFTVFKWATVTSASPLRVKIDGSATALTITPDTLVSKLTVGTRVFVLHLSTYMLVVGRSGGEPLPGPEERPSTSEVLTGEYSTLTAWRALSDGWYYNQNGSMAGMPTTWGMLYVRRRGSEGHVTYYGQPSGPEFRLTWNGSTTTVMWERQYFNRELDIAGTQNLNDYTSPGIYNFNQDVTATNGANFPINAAGVLEVMGVGTMRYQRYTVYRSHPGHVYYRNWYGSVWGAWEQMGKGLISGRVTIALPTAGTVGQASVSFPTNRFRENPSPTVTAWTTVPHLVGVSFSTLNTTSMLIHAVRTSGTGDLNVTWTASAIG